jgi:hypothetical protein
LFRSDICGATMRGGFEATLARSGGADLAMMSKTSRPNFARHAYEREPCVPSSQRVGVLMESVDHVRSCEHRPAGGRLTADGILVPVAALAGRHQR